MAITQDQKKIALVAGGALILILVWRWYSAQSSSSATNNTGTTAPDTTTSSDYAALAGQEQGDMANLQSQVGQISGQEQSDVAALQSQETTDVSGINSSLSNVTGTLQDVANQITGLAGAQSGLSANVASIALGEQAINRTVNGTIQTHKGGPFYNYYKTVTGHAPPATVAASNFIYQAWKSGVKASALTTGGGTHASTKNTHVQHPNGAHTPQRVSTPAHPNAGKPAPTKAAKPAPKPKAPPKASKPKASGVRK